MKTTRVFRPTMMSGIVYAREVGAAVPMQPIGGVEELTLGIDENKINQANTSTPGGGNRATVNRINELTFAATLQDLSPINLARALRATHTEVEANTVTDAAYTAYKDGLLPLPHVLPTSVVVKDSSNATIPAAGNYEVRPEGIWFYDNANAFGANATMAVKVSYAHSGFDVLEALTRSSPILEMRFAGLNEAFGDGTVGAAPQLVDIYRVSMSATQGLNLISAGEFATLAIEGEVLQDPTKTGVGISKYFKVSMYTPTV